MASFPGAPIADVHRGHKREQSQDSGAYIDWNSEDSSSPTGNPEAVTKGEFVTVVAVETERVGRTEEEEEEGKEEEDAGKEEDDDGGDDDDDHNNANEVEEEGEGDEASPYVTILEINDGDRNMKVKRTSEMGGEGLEEVLVYRLPGERLGFGLKFEGGTNTAENVKRLFIQSSAPDSPASRAECSWGGLTEGDEIVAIDGREVRNMTRLDCVRCLKESSVVIKLRVRHAERRETGPTSDGAEVGVVAGQKSPLVVGAEMKKKPPKEPSPPPPPPIPPRKVHKKSGAGSTLSCGREEDGRGQGDEEEGGGLRGAHQVPVPKARSCQPAADGSSIPSRGSAKSSVFVPGKEGKQDPPEVAKRPGKSLRGSFESKRVPPEAEVYLDVLAQEDGKNCESESDDTGSTISTVMGFSLSNAANSSFSDLRSNPSSYCDSTTPSTPSSTPSTPVLDAGKLIASQHAVEANEFLFVRMIGEKVLEGSAHDEKLHLPIEDGAPLQPPLSFQDAPLSYGNEDLKVSVSEGVFRRMERTLSTSEDGGEDADPSTPNKGPPQTSKGAGCGKKTSLIPRLAKSIGLLSPPKVSPRKEQSLENGKSRGGKKRPPPPPPPRSPPTNDAPNGAQREPGEGKSLKTSIPYLRKKAKGEGTKPEKEPAATNGAGERSEDDGGEIREEDAESASLCWAVPELKNCGSQSTRRERATAETPEATGVARGPSSTRGGDATAEAAQAREPFFAFQWGSAKHLETIGEDEENDSGSGENVEGRDELSEAAPATSTLADSPIRERDAGGASNGEGAKGAPRAEDVGACFADEGGAAAVPGRGTPREAGGPSILPEERAVNGGEEQPDDEDVIAAEKGNRKLGEAVLEEDALKGGMKEKTVPTVSAAASPVAPSPFGRPPPDGREFPGSCREEEREPSAMTGSGDAPAADGEPETELPPLPNSEPPMRHRFSFGPEKTVAYLANRRSFPSDVPDDSGSSRPGRGSLWRQDERSEKSVRDKIAMFSCAAEPPPGSVAPFGSAKLGRYKSSENVFFEDSADCAGSLPGGKQLSRSAVSIDRIGGSGGVRNWSKKGGFCEGSAPPRSLDLVSRTHSSTDLTSSSSSAYSSSCSPDSSLSSTASSYLGFSSTLPRKSSRSEGSKTEAGHKSSGLSRTTSFSLHGRSQSLLDVSPSPYKSRFRTEPSFDDDHRQTSLSSLIEQRRKNMTKLRGLVIPDKTWDPPPCRPILDLPEIRSRDFILASKLPNASKEEHRSGLPKVESPPTRSSSLLSLSSPPWRMPSKSPTVPKYSPAFKRKTISVYGTGSVTPRQETLPMAYQREEERVKSPAKPPRSVHHRRFDDFACGKAADSSKRGEKDWSPRTGERQSPCGGPPMRGKRGSPEEDSDDDSAVSSSRSSVSRGSSPPPSPSPSGRQTACIAFTAFQPDRPPEHCDGNSKRILKAQSVEAINRKNVLASAKYSRGFDAKSGSPLIQRKFGATADRLDDSIRRKYSNSSSESETTSYVLATEVEGPNAKSREVKIAFVNRVDEEDGEEEDGEEVEDEDEEEEEVFIEGPRKKEKSENGDGSLPGTTNSRPRGTGSALPAVAAGPGGRPRQAAGLGGSFDGGRPVRKARATPCENGRLGSFSPEAVPEICLDPGPPQERAAVRNRETGSYREANSNEHAGTRFREERTKCGAGKESAETPAATTRSQRSVSVHDVRRAFEKAEPPPQIGGRLGKPAATCSQQLAANGNHVRVSSLDSTNSEDGFIFAPGQYGSTSSLHREQFGSITSLASSTSLISPQELQSLIEEANQTLDESGGFSGGSTAVGHDVLVVILHRDTAGGSVGITLAGGADYESKEITVHKVLTGSPADRDGRIQKGDRILSINGRSMKGVTHRESLAILKSPRAEVVLVVSRPKNEADGDEGLSAQFHRPNRPPDRHPRIAEGTALGNSCYAGEAAGEEADGGLPLTFTLTKDGAGLGFSLEGGKDSPVGDRPLAVKKIFTGGAAEKCGRLKAGDEILNVNGIDVTAMSRIEAWKLMKRIPDGKVSVTVRRVGSARDGQR